MINLLPKEEKNNLLTDYRRRRTVVWLSMCLVLILLSALMTFTCWIMLFYRTSALTKVLNSTKYEMSNKTFNDLSQVVNTANGKLTIFLSNTSEIVRPSLVIKKIVDKRKSGLRILGIAYERKDSASASVTIRGKSNDRNALIRFVDALRQDPLFVTVDSPIANIIKQTDSDFNIMTVVKFTE